LSGSLWIKGLLLNMIYIFTICANKGGSQGVSQGVSLDKMWVHDMS